MTLYTNYTVQKVKVLAQQNTFPQTMTCPKLHSTAAGKSVDQYFQIYYSIPSMVRETNLNLTSVYYDVWTLIFLFHSQVMYVLPVQESMGVIESLTKILHQNTPLVCLYQLNQVR